MRRSFWQRLDLWARRMSPVLLTIVLVIINMLPMPLPELARVVPVLPLLAIYHWSIYAPELMPVPAVFLIGVLFDVLAGAPVGVNAVVFLIVYGVVSTQRRFLIGKAFTIVWLAFAVVALTAGGLGWALTSMYHVTVIAPEAFVIQGAITVGMFPLLGWLLSRWQRAMLPDL